MEKHRLPTREQIKNGYEKSIFALKHHIDKERIFGSDVRLMTNDLRNLICDMKEALLWGRCEICGAYCSVRKGAYCDFDKIYCDKECWVKKDE